MPDRAINIVPLLQNSSKLLYGEKNIIAIIVHSQKTNYIVQQRKVGIQTEYVHIH